MNTKNNSPLFKRRSEDAQRAIDSLRLIVISYALDSLILMLFAVMGFISVSLAGLYAVCGAVHGAAFSTAIRRGYSARQGDINLTLWQALFASTVQLAFLAMAPAASLLFVSVLFIIFSFGAAALTLRQTGFLFAVISAGLLLVMVSSTGFDAQQVMALPEKMLYAGVILSALGRCLIIGLWTAADRTKLRDQNVQHVAELVEVRQLATTDPLTGTLNRRSLIDSLRSLGSRRTNNRVMCIAMLDIDHFKNVNDNFGHVVGDEVLKQFARIVQTGLRSNDAMGRYGGEEFIVVLRGATTGGARIALERIRSAVDQFNWDHIASGLKITVSIGAIQQPDDHSPEVLVGLADFALYQAKHQGRNRVHVVPGRGRGSRGVIRRVGAASA